MKTRRPLGALASLALGASLLTGAGSASAQATPTWPVRPAPADAPSPKELTVASGSALPGAEASGKNQVDPSETPLARARRQVVVLLRAGKAIAMGVVLSGDGRILTALSPLGHGNDIEARFAEGKPTKVRVIHSDRAWDLALVAPAVGRNEPGLRASRATLDPKAAKLISFAPGAKDLATVNVRLGAERSFTGGDATELAHAHALESKHKSSELGSPVIDERGDVVAIIAQACAAPADKPCSLAPYAAPVPAIKAFLRGVPSGSSPPPPPFGIRGVAYDAGAVKGVRVVSLARRSAAARAGLRSGVDTIIAVNGRPVTSPEGLSAALEARGGRGAELLVFGGGRYRQIRLGAGPPERRQGFRRLDPWKRPPGAQRRSRRPGPR
ncbi:MAG: serine protease [Myxococcales bacterium]|nr:serine protease [Myxococcales bacterium]